MRVTSFESTLTDIYQVATSDFKHPLLTMVKFIFADDKPNGNNQGIKYEDFPQIIQSSIDTPIKMRFLGEAGAGGHSGSVVMGHIKGMSEETLDDGSHRLIADGVLYSDEYPNEIDYLKEAFAAGKAPGASWEISYGDEVKEGPVSWLKNILTRAATFVRNPAYGTRTALLALASDDSISDEDLGKGLMEIGKELLELGSEVLDSEELSLVNDETGPKNTNEGGSNKVEEELDKIKAELEAKIAEIETLKTVNAELEAKVSEKDTEIAGYKKATIVAERTAKVAEAGLKVEDDSLARKQEFWASLSDEAFAEYLADLAAAASKAPTKSATASLTDSLPRVAVESNDSDRITVEEMKANFRSRNRGR